MFLFSSGGRKEETTLAPNVSMNVDHQYSHPFSSNSMSGQHEESLRDSKTVLSQDASFGGRALSQSDGLVDLFPDSNDSRLDSDSSHMRPPASQMFHPSSSS